MLRSKRNPREHADPFVAAVEAVLDRMYATALRLTRSTADAEDLVQEALLRGLEAWPRLDPAGNVPGYLLRTLVNLFINRHRHARVARNVERLAQVGLLDGSTYSSESQKVWSDPCTRLDHTRFSANVEAALEALPDTFREVLVLSDILEFTYAEISDHLAIPMGTVMSRLFRARRFLRLRLAECTSNPMAKAMGIP
jgi:RNA polymerase sigma-70 factor (ECF subfamily)